MSNKGLASLAGACLVLAMTGVPAVPASAGPAGPAVDPAPPVVPALRSWTGGTGTFILTGRARIVIDDPAVAGEAATFGADLGRLTGHRVPVVSGSARPGDLLLRLVGSAPGNAEGYRLEIADTVTLDAANTTGLGHGEQTVEQLLALDPHRAGIPRGTAQDWPRYGERGVMIDVGRKYYQPSSVEQLIRTAAWYKLNTVHLHLTEYNAFRLNSPKFPGLAAAQSYDRADIDAFESVAARYHVTIIPEIDLPAHATAITDHWPQTVWDCAAMNNERGHDFTVDVTKPATLEVVKELLDEFVPWFSGPVFHVGTDEYPYQTTQEKCPELVDYAAANGYANTSDVMVGFIDYLDSIVRQNGRTTEAWGWWDAAGTPTAGPNKDIIVEAYGNDTDFNGRVGEQHFRSEGYQTVYADGNQLYVTPGLNLLPNDQSLYSAWPAVSDPNLRGYMVSRWSDNTLSDSDTFEDWYANRPEVVLADRTWGGPVLGTALDLENRADAIGAPPGLPGQPTDAVRLTGASYGSPGVDAAHGAAAVFDGDPTTFFDATDANGAYAGIDLGAGTTAQLNKIRFLPRSNQPARMTGGQFQGCATGPTTGCVTLATVTWNPATPDWRQLTVSTPGSFRWLRYVAPAGGYGNVAEVQFYRSPDVVASVQPHAPALLRASGPTTVSATVTNLTGHPLGDVTTSLTVTSVDAGAPLTARPVPPVTLPVVFPHRSATVSWHLTAAPTATPGEYRVTASTATLRGHGRGTDRSNAGVLSTLPFQNLAAAFDNVGTTADADVDPPALNGGVDGDGSSYSAEALAAAGATPGRPVTHGGLTFTWPAAAPGTPDNVAAAGQAILVGAAGSTIGMLVTATYVAPGTFAGTGTITYTDGSTAPFTVSVPEWQHAYTAPADEALSMTYHNYAPAGQVTAPTRIFFVAAPLDPAKTVAWVALPAAGAGRATLHVFAIAVG